MGKGVAYTVAAITFMGIGALATGLALFFIYPNMGRESSAYTDPMPRKAQCVLTAASGYAVQGSITFMQDDSSSPNTVIAGTVTGLSEGPHGFHIHEFGVTGGDCKAAAGHFNPANMTHGGPTSSKRHVGDLGNIQSVVDAQGSTVSKVQITDHLVTLYGDRSVLGRAVVIHAGEDDLGASGHSAGAAGARVACCTIYLVPN